MLFHFGCSTMLLAVLALYKASCDTVSEYFTSSAHWHLQKAASAVLAMIAEYGQHSCTRLRLPTQGIGQARVRLSAPSYVIVLAAYVGSQSKLSQQGQGNGTRCVIVLAAW